MRLMQGDCLELMKTLPDNSIDMVLTDPPYGTTACKWDNLIDFAAMWAQVRRVIKENGAILLFGGEPFSSRLRLSLIKEYRYDWVWNKKKAANFLFGNKQPLKMTEQISVFYKSQPTYNPQKTDAKEVIEKTRGGNGTAIFEHMKNAPKQSKPGKSREFNKRLPTNIISFSKPWRPVHPTQKPVALLEYLIKTYTLEGETVLDFTMGSGSTGVACVNTKREFIGIELDEKYFAIAEKRIADSTAESKKEK